MQEAYYQKIAYNMCVQQNTFVMSSIKKRKKNILFLELSKKVIIFVRENKKIKTKNGI